MKNITHTQILVELINEFSKFVRHNINIGNIVLFYTLTINNLKMKLREQFYL